MKILIVDGDSELADITAYLLRRHGYQPIVAADGDVALALWRREQPSLVLLAVHLPRQNGWQVCRAVRQASDVPILMTTVRDTEAEAVRALDLGADDYLVKPFRPRELLARIRAVLRRANASQQPLAPVPIHCGPLTIDVSRQQATLDNATIPLTSTEFRLLLELARHPGHVVTYQVLSDRVWDAPVEATRRTLKTHIHHLRRKLSCPDRSGRISVRIVNVAEYGYSLSVAAESVAHSPPGHLSTAS